MRMNACPLYNRPRSSSLQRHMPVIVVKLTQMASNIEYQNITLIIRQMNQAWLFHDNSDE